MGMVWRGGKLIEARIAPDKKETPCLFRIPEGAELVRASVSGRAVIVQKTSQPQLYRLEMPWKQTYLLTFK